MDYVESIGMVLGQLWTEGCLSDWDWVSREQRRIIRTGTGTEKYCCINRRGTGDIVYCVV